MPQRNLLIVLVFSAFSYACYVRCEKNPYAQYAASSYEWIDNLALDDVPNEELYAGAIEGMVGVLQSRGDEHSRYIKRVEVDAFQTEMRQQFGGIGVRIRPLGEPPQLTVVGPPEPNSPAARAGILAGDVISAIDGVPTEGLDMLGILHHMRGEVGSPITLEVIHLGDDLPVTLELTREVITIDSILGDRRLADGNWKYRLDNDPRIALVRIIHFGDKTVAELRDVLAQLTTDGVQALVLDLRDNAGGALDAAVAASDMFLEGGLPIVEIRGRHGQLDDRYVASGKGKYKSVPLAVLINQNSASASEIVAACLQDHRRAAVFGSRSFGKGTVQRVLEVGSRGRSLLKLTSASYWRPSGKNIHRMPGDEQSDSWGVTPSDGCQVEMSDDQYVQYREYRSGRDLMQHVGRGEALESAGSDDSDGFADQAMELAVEHLQQSLANQ